MDDLENKRKNYYSNLHTRFLVITMVCSLLPLLVVGWGINIHYTSFARDRMTDNFQTRVDYHRRTIELFLAERAKDLDIISRTHSLEYVADSQNLLQVFYVLNRKGGAFTDLGVIDSEGRHLAYVGPYELLDKNYKNEHWFREVIEHGVYVSDMFLGFRGEPHFVIAVARPVDDGASWILRATVDTDAFRGLVENVKIGRSGEVYLLNEEGRFQTKPRLTGEIMEQDSTPVEPFHENIVVRVSKARAGSNGEEVPSQIVAQAWISRPRWVLVVKQDFVEAMEDVNHANRATLLFVHLAAGILLLAVFFTSRHMMGIIRRQDHEADQLNAQLIQTGKLASIGELSAGVAHEINNPLAIIMTEKQLLQDASGRVPVDQGFKEQLDRSLDQIGVQLKRCKTITQNLLRFSRRTRSVIEPTDLNEFLGEIVALMEREARSNGIKFFTDFDPDLKPLLSDPSQLQQVFLNLITNAIDAHEGKSYGQIFITTQTDNIGGARISVADTGFGIPRENLDKIFDPFFTTKPVGRGTGLGLSICYSIVKKLGGDIQVISEPGHGAEFVIYLPGRPPGAVNSEAADPAKARIRMETAKEEPA